MSNSLSTSEAIRTRRAVRKFSSQKVQDQLVYELLELSNRAPSGFNLQPWHFILVRDQELQGLLYHIALQQKQIIEAPLTVVFAANQNAWRDELPHIIKTSVEEGLISEEYAQFSAANVRSQFRTGPFGLSGFAKRVMHPLRRLTRPLPDPLYTADEVKQYARAQTMIAASTFMIAASGAGLATSPIEGFDERRLKKLLAIPSHYSVPVIVSLGYPLETESQSDSYRVPLLEKLSVDIFPNKLSRIKAEKAQAKQIKPE